MHLRQRRIRDRFLVELREARERAAAERLFPATLDLGERARWHAVLELLELLAVRCRQKGAHHAQHLSHLDENAAQVSKASGEAPRVSPVRSLEPRLDGLARQ